MGMVRRLVRTGGDREPPDSLIRQLREIDPSLELVYAGDGWWWLGSVREPTQFQIRGANLLLEQEANRATANPRNLLRATLALQGFRYIAEYRSEGDPGVEATFDRAGRRVAILEDVQERHHNWAEDPEQGEAVFQDRLAVSGGEDRRQAGRARLLDAVETIGLDAYRFQRRRNGRPGILVPEQRGTDAETRLEDPGE